MHIYIQNEVKNEIASISVFKKQVLFIKLMFYSINYIKDLFTSTNFDWLKLTLKFWPVPIKRCLRNPEVVA